MVLITNIGGRSRNFAKFDGIYWPCVSDDVAFRVRWRASSEVDVLLVLGVYHQSHQAPWKEYIP